MCAACVLPFLSQLTELPLMLHTVASSEGGPIPNQPPTPLGLYSIPIEALISRGVDNPAAWGFNALPQTNSSQDPASTVVGAGGTGVGAAAARDREMVSSPTAVSSNLSQGAQVGLGL